MYSAVTVVPGTVALQVSSERVEDPVRGRTLFLETNHPFENLDPDFTVVDGFGPCVEYGKSDLDPSQWGVVFFAFSSANRVARASASSEMRPASRASCISRAQRRASASLTESRSRSVGRSDSSGTFTGYRPRPRSTVTAK